MKKSIGFGKKNISKLLKAKASGSYAVQYTIILLAFLILFMSMVSEYQSTSIIRSLEAASDLACVEALRSYIDDNSLRNERLEVVNINSPYPDERNETLANIRDLYLDKMRTSLPTPDFDIIRIEIPTVVDGRIEVPADYETASFPNSTSIYFSEPVTIPVTDGNPRTAWYLGGTSEKNSGMYLVYDTNNLGSSGNKKKESYFLTMKTTIIFDGVDLFNQYDKSLVNFMNIFENDGVKTTIETIQVNNDVTAVTLQTVGRVTLR